ncbi:MAG TPA: group II intron reverse transcriptase/maturase [Acidimicrobiales bacterium]|nr:group II intron reverse transcriptase/maturase [Acidimicrobiales bacterium]
MDLWESLLSRENLTRALRRVERNGGAPGPDGMTTAELRPWLKANWPEIRQRLDAGTYRPSAVRRVMIPKPGGGERELGVPTVLDRFLQQALGQVLSPVFEPTFSEASYGFRPGRSAHQAVNAARRAIEAGETFVVDVDLERFFDRVQHDALMARVARRVGDRRVLKLIRRYLDAGVMVSGVKVATVEGTPQGSPLSPLLANIMLDDLDHELERRGHTFVRYADDLRVYVASERAAARVLEGVTDFVEQRLHLRVNRAKSGVAHATHRGLLGFGFFRADGRVKVRLDPKAKGRLRARLRRLTSRRQSIAMAVRLALLNRFLLGWAAYFALAETPSVFAEFDEWLRRRLRQVRWKEWKRFAARRRNLVALGIPDGKARQWAASRKGYWRLSGSPPVQRALSNRYWADLGLVLVSDRVRRLRENWRTAGCGPARPVVWEGPS